MRPNPFAAAYTNTLTHIVIVVMQAAVYELLRRGEVRAEVQEDAKLVLRDLWSLAKVPLRLPCTNPCSLMRSDLGTLLRQRYKVGAKTDGIRFFLLFAHLVNDDDTEEEYALLVDRAFTMFPVDVLRASSSLFEGTLLDGELVRRGDSLTFVAFDTVASCGFSFKSRPHSERVAELHRLSSQVMLACVSFVVKQWLPLSPHAVQQLTAESGTQEYESDGLILVAELKELVVGMQRDMFKWKPASLHTIDFLKQGADLFLVDGTSFQSAAALNISRSPLWLPDSPDGVMECHCVKVDTTGAWHAVPLKPRVDKAEPNSVYVARLTLQNIEEDITVQELATMLEGKHSPTKMPAACSSRA